MTGEKARDLVIELERAMLDLGRGRELHKNDRFRRCLNARRALLEYIAELEAAAAAATTRPVAPGGPEIIQPPT
jgi:hypothetical protein